MPRKKKKKLTIVIDGPAGSGKSTVCRRLAKQLNYLYLDTGALYRCVAVEASKKNIPVKNSRNLFALAKKCRISFKKGRSRQRVFLNGKDVSRVIRTPRISLLASQYSRLPYVRKALLHHQRQLGKEGGIVAEGRDLGTVVFPKADVKFFLVATIKERAKRRYLELKQKTKKVALTQVEKEVRSRDRADAKRAISPLKRAKDARRLDTTAMSIDQVVDEMYRVVKQRYEDIS